MRQSIQSTRSYPRNSPHAAGRLVALALISNGEIKAVEWAKLCEIEAGAQLGLAGHEWHDIVEGLCRDLLATAPTLTSCLIDRKTLARWFDELDDRELQTLVIRLIAELVVADGRIDQGESALLRVASDCWGGQAPQPARPSAAGRPRRRYRRTTGGATACRSPAA